MFPLYDSIRTKRFPFLNLLLIVSTLIVFFQEILAPNPDAFITKYALIPANVHFLDWHTLLPFVTAIFLHGGFLHILSNLWFLFIFGDNVEDELPAPVFLLLFFLAGVVGNVVEYILLPGSTIPLLGASGAIAGILGCYFIMFPHSKVKTLVFIIFFVTIADIAAPIMLGYWFILQLFSSAASLQLPANQGGVAFGAHVAGFIVGIIFGKLFKPRPVNDMIIEGEIVS
jgi:membrane associated rhomboid family serine protease